MAVDCEENCFVSETGLMLCSWIQISKMNESVDFKKHRGLRTKTVGRTFDVDSAHPLSERCDRCERMRMEMSLTGLRSSRQDGLNYVSALVPRE